MPRLQYKPFASPDHERVPHGSAQVVTPTTRRSARSLGAWWRWSTHLAPIAGTASRRFTLGYAISGRLRGDGHGQSLEIPGGPPTRSVGHDASVVGDEAFVTLEWTVRVVGVAAEGGNEADPRHGVVHRHRRLTAALGRWATRGGAVLGEHNRRIVTLNRYRGREIDDGRAAPGPVRQRVAGRPLRAGDGLGQGHGDRDPGRRPREVELVGDNARPRGPRGRACPRGLAIRGRRVGTTKDRSRARGRGQRGRPRAQGDLRRRLYR